MKVLFLRFACFILTSPPTRVICGIVCLPSRGNDQLYSIFSSIYCPWLLNCWEIHTKRTYRPQQIVKTWIIWCNLTPGYYFLIHFFTLHHLMPRVNLRYILSPGPSYYLTKQHQLYIIIEPTVLVLGFCARCQHSPIVWSSCGRFDLIFLFERSYLISAWYKRWSRLQPCPNPFSFFHPFFCIWGFTFMLLYLPTLCWRR